MQSTVSPVAVKLTEAYEKAVNEGQVLDVSGVRIDGTGTRRIDYPRSANGTKKWIGELPIVSNNYNAYAFAVTNMGVPDADVYTQAFLDAYGDQPIERQVVQTRPVPTTPMPSAEGVLVVPVTQVTVKSARSPAKRPAQRRAQGTKRAQSPRAPQVQQAPTARAPVDQQAPMARAPMAPMARAPMAPAPLAQQRQPAPRVPSPPRNLQAFTQLRQ